MTVIGVLSIFSDILTWSNRPGNTDLRGLKVDIGHNGVIHTLDRGPNLVAKGQIGDTIN